MSWTLLCLLFCYITSYFNWETELNLKFWYSGRVLTLLCQIQRELSANLLLWLQGRLQIWLLRDRRLKFSSLSTCSRFARGASCVSTRPRSLANDLICTAAQQQLFEGSESGWRLSPRRRWDLSPAALRQTRFAPAIKAPLSLRQSRKSRQTLPVAAEKYINCKRRKEKHTTIYFHHCFSFKF